MTKDLTAFLPDDRKLIRIAPLLLLLIGLLVLLPGTFSLPLLDRDEPRFAQATVEMMDRGDWVIPWFNGEYRFDKPPMTYWLMRGGYALFGVNEFGARFHSVVCAISLALLLFYTGRRWFSAQTGFLAGLFSLTALQTLIHGRSGVADMPMILAVALSCIALYELLKERDSNYPWRWFWTLHLSLAFGFLAKGPIAWAVPLLALLLLRFALWREPLPWKRIKLLKGLPVILLPVAAWGIPALLQTNGAFWNVGMGEHVVERGYSVFNSRKFIPGYYLLTALFSLFPWIALLGLVWRIVRNSRTLLIRWLAAWLLAPYLIFSLYLTQLPHYVMPGFAAFFLLLAEALKQKTVMPKWGLRLKRFVAGLGMALAVIALIAAALVPLPAAVNSLRFSLAGLGAVVAGLTGMLYLNRFRRVLAPVLVAAGFLVIGSGLRPCIPGPQLQALFASLPAGTVCAFSEYTEPHLVFYSHRQWIRCKDLQSFLDGAGPRLLVVQEKQFRPEDVIKRKPAKDISAKLDALHTGDYRIVKFEGFNPARGAFMTLRIYYRMD